MEGPISFWGYQEQESNLILPEHDDDDDDGFTDNEISYDGFQSFTVCILLLLTLLYI